MPWKDDGDGNLETWIGKEFQIWGSGGLYYVFEYSEHVPTGEAVNEFPPAGENSGRQPLEKCLAWIAQRVEAKQAAVKQMVEDLAQVQAPTEEQQS